MIRIFFTLLIVAVSLTAKAQYISPTDLLHMNALWQINDPHCDKNTYDYLMTVDSSWIPRSKPTIDDKGYMSIIGYTKDHKNWYLPTEEMITLAIERGTVKKSLSYRFTDPNTWAKYNKQMMDMNATKLGSAPSNGGQQTIYQVNDIGFVLTEYPPGIKGDDRTFEVTLLKGD